MRKYKGNASVVLKPRSSDQLSQLLAYCSIKRLAVVPQVRAASSNECCQSPVESNGMPLHALHATHIHSVHMHTCMAMRSATTIAAALAPAWQSVYTTSGSTTAPSLCLGIPNMWCPVLALLAEACPLLPACRVATQGWWAAACLPLTRWSSAPPP